jgi:hypothetical protein
MIDLHGYFSFTEAGLPWNLRFSFTQPFDIACVLRANAAIMRQRAGGRLIGFFDLPTLTISSENAFLEPTSSELRLSGLSANQRSSSGITRRMNSSKSGTVKVMSPWAGL